MRDTALIEDLKTILSSNHAYVKTYAFGALAHRKTDGLFKVIIDNMADTTEIHQFTSDAIYVMYPAEIMIWYLLNDLSKKEKRCLTKLIETKDKYLKEVKLLLTGI